MQHDERTTSVKYEAERLGYLLLHYLLLAVFLYFALIRGQSSTELLVVLAIWLGVFFTVETMKALKGIPPISDRPTEHRWVAVLSATVSAFVAGVFVWLAGMSGLWPILRRCMLVFVAVLGMFQLWLFLYRFWERRLLDT